VLEQSQPQAEHDFVQRTPLGTGELAVVLAQVLRELATALLVRVDRCLRGGRSGPEPLADLGGVLDEGVAGGGRHKLRGVVGGRRAHCWRRGAGRANAARAREQTKQRTSSVAEAPRTGAASAPSPAGRLLPARSSSSVFAPSRGHADAAYARNGAAYSALVLAESCAEERERKAERLLALPHALLTSKRWRANEPGRFRGRVVTKRRLERACQGERRGE